MREIKFRAWNKEDKVMVYEDEDHTSNYWDGVCASTVQLVNNELQYKSYGSSKYVWMQFTGLKDKNGKEIYESDVVKIPPDDVLGLRYAPFEVKFGTFGTYTGWNIRREECEVIGDIYSNPELLKESA